MSTIVASPPSATLGPLTTTPINWWIKDPLDASSGIAINVVPNVKTSINEGQGIFPALARKYPIVVSDVVHGEDGSLTAWVHTDAALTALRALLLRQTVLFLRSPYAEQWYIRRTGPLQTARPYPYGWQTQTAYREVTFTYVEQPMP